MKYIEPWPSLYPSYKRLETHSLGAWYPDKIWFDPSRNCVWLTWTLKQQDFFFVGKKL